VFYETKKMHVKFRFKYYVFKVEVLKIVLKALETLIFKYISYIHVNVKIIMFIKEEVIKKNH